MSAMTEIVDVTAIGECKRGRVVPIHWGTWGLIAVETMVFAALFSTYLYLSLMSDEWPPAGVEEPKLLLPTINTGILLASTYFVHKADRGIEEGDQRWLNIGLAAGGLLAVVFLVVKIVEYSDIPYRWDSHAYGSIVWTITGFHTLHVIVLILKTVVMLVLGLRGRFTAEDNIGVQVNGLYWRFVVAIWLPVYAFLYWAPRVLP